METKLPKRKHPRLSEYDYSSAGAYFITICTHNRKCVLSRIVGRIAVPAAEKTVGRIAAPAAEKTVGRIAAPAAKKDVGRIAASAEEYDVEYTEFGKIAEQQLLKLEERYPFLKVGQYVIMPNHIHAILVMESEAAGASPRPTVMDVVCAYKSLTTRACRQNGFADKLFQTSFYEHVIRNQQDYNEIAEYICQNPMRWQSDDLFV